MQFARLCPEVSRLIKFTVLQEMAELQIHVQAYGVQLFQLESCLQAMTSAFPDHFAFDTYNPDIK